MSRQAESRTAVQLLTVLSDDPLSCSNLNDESSAARASSTRLGVSIGQDDGQCLDRFHGAHTRNTAMNNA